LLGELGFPGLILLLVFIGSNLLANRSMLNEVGRLSPDDAATASNLLSSTSASLVGFAVGGAFLSAAYYPHLYVLSGLLVAARQVVRLHLEARQSAGREHPAAVATAVARRPVRSGEISPEWKPSPTYRIGDLGRDRA
jgi:hypothetical protein